MKRICNKCKEKKALKLFTKNKNGKFGRRSICKKCDKVYQAKFYIKNKEKILKTNSLWIQNNYKKYRKYQNKQREENITHVRVYHKEYLKQKRANDIGFKISHNIKVRIRQAIKNSYKSLSTMGLIGCSVDYLMYHLQEQFVKGMSWDNYGDWHIDHIKPCASFDFSKPEQQRKCFHYSNMQPLWAEDNQKKSWKYKGVQYV